MIAGAFVVCVAGIAATAMLFRFGPPRVLSADEHFRRGLALSAAGRPALAAGELRRALRLDPARREARRELIRCYLAAGDGVAAIVELERLDEHGRQTDDEWLYALILEGRFDEVLRRTDGLGDGASAEALRLRAWTLLRVGRVEEAKAAYTALATRFPRNAEAQLGLARVALKQSRLGDAYTRLLPFLGEHPKRGDAWLTLGQLLDRTGQYDSAAKAFSRAAVNLENDTAAQIGLAETMLAQGKLAEGGALIESLRSNGSKDPAVAAVAGESAELAGDASAATAAYLEALTENPSDYRVLTALGALRLRNDDAWTAESVLSRARLLRPERPEASLLLALLYAKTHERSKSLQVLGELLAHARRPGGVYRLCAEGPRRLSFEELSDLLGAWLAVHPNDVAARLTLALEADAAGRAYVARSGYREVLRRDPGNAIATQQLSSAAPARNAALMLGMYPFSAASGDASEIGNRIFGCALT